MRMHEEWDPKFLARGTYQMDHSGLTPACLNVRGGWGRDCNVVNEDDHKFGTGILMGISM